MNEKWPLFLSRLTAKRRKAKYRERGGQRAKRVYQTAMLVAT